jgi:hypothetical protein
MTSATPEHRRTIAAETHRKTKETVSRHTKLLQFEAKPKGTPASSKG